ncbi:MAG: hypothetical protein IJW92_02725 [Clostridia bacterium]|nr:hypothetical protein [Clostridia bacterium]
MKSFIAMLILLCLALAGIGVNFFYVNSFADRMERLITDLPDIQSPDCVSAAEQIHAYWEENAPLLGLSIGYSIIDRVGEQSCVLVACAEVGDVYGFYSAAALLLDAVGDLRRAERFSIENLL